MDPAPQFMRRVSRGVMMALTSVLVLRGIMGAGLVASGTLLVASRAAH